MGVALGFSGYLVVECSFDDAYGYAHILNVEPLSRFDQPTTQVFTSCYLAQRIPNRR